MNKIAANPLTISTRRTISSRAPCCPRHYRASVMGEPPIGRNVVFCGVKIFRIADGTIVER